MIEGARLATKLAVLRRPAGARVAVAALAGAVALCLLVSVRAGAMSLSTGQVVAILLDRLGIATPWAFDGREATVLWALRLPRVALAMLVGATLATSGAAMQGLFRNPLADPALLGVASSASLGAVLGIAFSTSLPVAIRGAAGPWLIPAMAFSAGLLATAIGMRLARDGPRTSTAVMLLVGVALNALAGAGIGLAMHLASDAELRNITFWTLGSFGGAAWRVLLWTGPALIAATLGLCHMARPLNALLLGEREAAHLGVSVERTRRAIVILTALGVGASVAISGVIGFVGLVVPHVVRAVLGPDHRRLLPASALAGAGLACLADSAARTLVAPAELPVGVVTAAIGAPFFLWQLAMKRHGVLAR